MAGQRIADAAWCYPEPSAGRENLKDHITFATGKGIAISEPPAAASRAPARGGGGGGAAKRREAKALPQGGGREDPAGRSDYDSQIMRSLHAPMPGSSSVPSVLPSVPSPPAAALALGLFDPALLSTKFLELDNGGSTVLCHTNCGRQSQGTAFLNGPPFMPGHRYRLAIRIDSKPGRMCYFIGVSPKPFDLDAGQAAIRTASYSLENLSASLHIVGKPCAAKAPPLFHVGSTITMDVDLTSKPCMLRFSGLAGGAVKETSLPRVPLRGFVSLYNRLASFTIVSAEQV